MIFPAGKPCTVILNAGARMAVGKRLIIFWLKRIRLKAGRNARPTAVILDSQRIKTTACGSWNRGYDGGKQINGRKRFFLNDIQGLLLAVCRKRNKKMRAKCLLRYVRWSFNLRELCSHIKLIWVG